MGRGERGGGWEQTRLGEGRPAAPGRQARLEDVREVTLSLSGEQAER